MVAQLSSPIDLTDKKAIVTGASRGIGQAICFALAREGAHVAACDIRSTSETVAGIEKQGQKTLGIACDVLQEDQVRKAVETLRDAWGSIDILINNAAILGDSQKAFDEITVEEWDHLMETNLRGTFLMTQAVWPHMANKRGGKIVCLGSLAGRIGGILAGPHYCASKGGIHAFVKWAAKKGASLGIYVNGIAPGPIETPMIANEGYSPEGIPLGRLGQPEDIAMAAIFLASQASNYITGQILDVNGGMLMV